MPPKERGYPGDPMPGGHRVLWGSAHAARGAQHPVNQETPPKKLLPHEITLRLLGVQACSPHVPPPVTLKPLTPPEGLCPQVFPSATMPAGAQDGHCQPGCRVLPAGAEDAAQTTRHVAALGEGSWSWSWQGNTAFKGTPRAPSKDRHPLSLFRGQELGAGCGGGTSDLPMAGNTPLALRQSSTSWVLPCQPCVQRTAGGSGGTRSGGGTPPRQRRWQELWWQ